MSQPHNNITLSFLDVNSKNTKGLIRNRTVTSFFVFYQKLKPEACNFTKINTFPWVFFTFFRLYKWYQIAQRTTYLCHFFSLLWFLVFDVLFERIVETCSFTSFLLTFLPQIILLLNFKNTARIFQ